MKNYKKQIYLFMSFFLLIAFVSNGLIFNNFQKQTDLQKEILRVEKSLNQTDSLINNLLQIESEKRAFQLTSNSEYLDKFNSAIERCNRNVDMLKESNLSKNDKSILGELDSLFKLRIANIESGVQIFRASGFESSVDYMEIESKKEIRKLFAAKLISFKNQLLERVNSNRASLIKINNNNKLDLLVLFIMFITGIIISTWAIIKSQQKIIKDHKRFQEAQRIAKMGSWEWDITSNKITWSKTQYHLFGEDPKTYKITYDGYMSHLSENDKMLTSELIIEALEGKKKYEIEHEIIRKDGTKILVFEQGTVLYDDNGKATGMFGTTQDITERKITEEKNRSEQQLLRTLIDNIPDTVYAKDSSLRKILANKSDMFFMGVKTEEEYMGKTDFELFPNEEGGGAGHKNDLLLIESGQPVFNKEEVFMDPNGVHRCLLSTKIPMYNEDGSFKGILGIGRDVTQLKIVENELKESQKKFQSIFDNAADGIYQSTVDGKFIVANNAVARIFGFDSPESLINSVTNIGVQHYADPADHKRMVEILSKDDRIENFEAPLLKKNNDIVWVSKSTRIVRDEKGDIKYFEGTLKDITERKKAEEALNNSEERYRQIVETAQEGIWVLDENNYTIFVNKKMCEILEYTREEMMGKQNYYFKDEEGKQKAKQDIERRKDGITETQISKFITKSGKIIWTSVSTNPILNDEGKYIGALGMFTDITERKKIDEELIVAQKKFQEIFDNAADGIYQSTVDGRFIMANAAVARIFGFDTAEELISTVTNIGEQHYADPDDRVRMAELLSMYDHIENYEVPLFTKNKTIVWVSESARIVRDDNGEIKYFEGTLKDITERKRAEEELGLVQKKYQEIFDNTAYGIYHSTLDGKFAMTNPSMARIFGYDSPDDLIISVTDISTQIYADPEDREKMSIILMDKGEVENYEIQCLKKNKDIIWVSLNIRIVRNEDGDIDFFEGTLEDITKRKETDEEILQLNKSLDQFANITAHDLQEPIRMVSGFLGLLEKKYSDAIDEQGKSYIHRAKDGADRMSILIKDLLEFSRSGNKAAKKEPVDMAVVMDLVRKDLSIVVSDTNSIINIPESLPVVIGTQSALYRLFLNLISNGIKFRKKDTAPEVTLNVEEFPEFWSFTLQDNGIGVAEKDQPKLFQAFQRLHRRDEYPGTGLGLVTCKKIVEIHGGKIGMTSEAGKGTAFHFTLSKAS